MGKLLVPLLDFGIVSALRCVVLNCFLPSPRDEWLRWSTSWYGRTTTRNATTSRHGRSPSGDGPARNGWTASPRQLENDREAARTESCKVGADDDEEATFSTERDSRSQLPLPAGIPIRGDLGTSTRRRRISLRSMCGKSSRIMATCRRKSLGEAFRTISPDPWHRRLRRHRRLAVIRVGPSTDDMSTVPKRCFRSQHSDTDPVSQARQASLPRGAEICPSCGAKAARKHANAVGAGDFSLLTLLPCPDSSVGRLGCGVLSAEFQHCVAGSPSA